LQTDKVNPAHHPKARQIIAAASILAATFAGTAQADDWALSSSSTQQPAQARDDTRTFNFAIPTEPLAIALNAFSTTTRIQLLYDSQIVAGHSSSSVVGKLNASAALRILLADSGLESVNVSPGTLTLVMRSQDLKFASTSPIAAPTLALAPLHVTAPSVVNHKLYAMTVQYAIQNALQRDHYVCQNSYRTEIMVWVTPMGVIQHSTFLVPTGDTNLNTAIERIVGGVAIGQAPPSGLPQPVHVRIVARGARS
jgi:hypothetical protein